MQTVSRERYHRGRPRKARKGGRNSGSALERKTILYQCLMRWRRGRDSNPRYPAKGTTVFECVCGHPASYQPILACTGIMGDLPFAGRPHCFTSHSIPRRSFAPRLQTIPYAEVWDSFHLGVSSGPNRPVLCRGPIPLFRCRRKKNSGPFHPRQLHAAVDSLSQTENPGIRISAGRARNSARRRLAHGLAGECGGRQASPGRARRRPPGQSSSRGSCGAGGRCAAQVSAALRRSGKAQASMMSLTSSCRSALNVWYHCHSAS
jgi:hypothetical protein